MTLHTTEISSFRKYVWLLRREFWENRGGFLWAPLITGGVICLFTLLAAIAAWIQWRKSNAASMLQISGLEHIANQSGTLGYAMDGSLLSSLAMLGVVLAFVVFFYSLGALYDDRRDRSLLFWRSLPVSDGLTLLSKLTWALLLAPLIAIVTGVVTGICLLLIWSTAMSLGGISGAWSLVWQAHPWQVFFKSISLIPVYMAWALPSVGWLLLCSAAVRSKPFLWAVLLPILTAMLLSWINIFPGVAISYQSVWYALGYRGLLSVVPGSWYIDSHLTDQLGQAVAGLDTPDKLGILTDISHGWQIFAGKDVWIGLLIGTGMIALALWFRRKKEDI